MVIQHNVSALIAQDNYRKNNGRLSKNLEKLSSGYRINRAGDDAAGLAVSEKMRVQISGLKQAEENCKDGISLIQTGEGALQEVHGMLDRLETLAEQSANGTYEDTTDRDQLQKELEQITAEIDRISKTTNFNGIALFQDNGLEAESNAKLSSLIARRSVIYAAMSAPTENAALTAHVTNNAPIENVSALTQLSNAPKATTNPFTVTDGIEGKDYSYNANTGALQIRTDTAMTISGGTNDTGYGWIQIQNNVNANLTLNDVSINASGLPSRAGIDCGQGNTVKLTFTGNNNEILANGVAAGIQVRKDTKLTIDGGGTLDVTGGRMGGAGIGGEYGANTGNSSVTINSAGTITATGGGDTNKGGAGIGAGYAGKFGAITVNSGAITATGGIGSAGIGNGYHGQLTGDITINGGTITARSSGHGAGIGGGWVDSNYGGIQDITINGGTITAFSAEHGPGIGSGCQGKMGNLTITGGTITATGGNDGAAIGAGAYSNSTAKDITISGGTITATGGANGSGIGSGAGRVDNITITGDAVVYATGQQDSSGIGSGKNGAIQSVTINGNAVVTATGGWTNGGGNIGGYSTTGSTSNPIDVTIGSNASVLAGSGEGRYITSSENWRGGANIEGNDGTTPLYSLALTDENIKDWLKAAAGANNNRDLSSWPLTVKITTADGTTLQKTLSKHMDGTAHKVNGAYLWLKGQRMRLSVTDAKNSSYSFDLSFSGRAGVWYLTGTEEPAAAPVPGYSDAQPTTPPPPYTDPDAPVDPNAPPPDDPEEPTPEEPIEPEIAPDPIILQIGPSFGETLEIPRFYFSAKALGLDQLDISTQEKAFDTLNKLGTIIDRVSSIRGTYGALQNRLEHTLDNLGVMRENMQDAESALRDTDMAEEMMAYTKNNILSQSAQAMLAQANQEPQGVLQLLQ